MEKLRDKVDLTYLNAKSRIKNALTSKHAGLSGIIVAIGLILIAIIIILIFKSAVQPSIEGAIDETTGAIDKLTNEVSK